MYFSCFPLVAEVTTNIDKSALFLSLEVEKIIQKYPEFK